MRKADKTKDIYEFHCLCDFVNRHPKYVRGVLGNKCAGPHNLKTVHFKEKLASGNFLAWLSGVCVFFAALYLP
jgi:hypothetical protein